LDRSALISLPHLQAALALWHYAEGSARWIFGAALGDPTADKILAALRTRPGGMTRTDIRDLFSRTKRDAEIARALEVLHREVLARVTREAAGGRGAERWYAVDTTKTTDDD